ncbi:unnamed protein product [Ambrosiozyma monospora]|uniref:ferric-chelate reductase (NADPH) n=1 Tax=Ambrosiozyma monospora TaxID=43982 RepID=A0A9W6YZ01_AMBMO|nr:unnamed protein product [Ambrosiozyma monospora]
MGFYPGCYVYLHFLSLPFYVAWQSHPFSLVRSTTSNDRLVLYMKCKKGITRKLLKLQNKEFIKVLIDGPYGTFPVETRNDDEFDKVVGIGGGLALCSVLTFFNHRAAKFQDKSANGNGQNNDSHKYKLNWIINDMAQLDLIRENLEWLCKKGIPVDVYYTRYQAQDSDDTAKIEQAEANEQSQLPGKIEQTEHAEEHHCCGGSAEDSTDTESQKEKLDKTVSRASSEHTKSPKLLNIKYGKPSMDELLPKDEQVKRRVYVCAPDGLLKAVREHAGDLDELVVEKHTW